jgi:hypothetical protein
MKNFNKYLIDRFWQYQKERFPDLKKYFDREEATPQRPPVFLKHTADYNILMKPDITEDEKKMLISEIPAYERHRWFRSTKSSQALAQSIFGNLKIYGRINVLDELSDESGNPLFEPANITPDNFTMEYSINYLGEPRRTSVDAFISGDYQIAIECKLSEGEFGTCSRPRLKEKDSNYEKDFCDGSYTHQRGRSKRCSLTQIDVLYWKYVPGLFTWQSDSDLRPCPLNKNYQLIRNLLGACVRSDGTLSPEQGHVVIIYDMRNPAFKKGGKAYSAFEETKAALRHPHLLKKCSWQLISEHLNHYPELRWLTEDLQMKYGL